MDEGQGSSTRHILSVSPTEMRDQALLNDAQSTDFSFRKAFAGGRSVPRSHFVKFAFSYLRERDWSNVLAFHSRSSLAYLWSAEKHAISDTQISCSKDKKTGAEFKEGEHITAVAVSRCGNFGVLGFNSGRIIKFAMQSGAFKYKLNCYSVGDLAIDCSNKLLVNASS